MAVFALGNAQAVTARFLFWQLQSSMAVVVLVATAGGMLIAGPLGLRARLRHWNRGRVAMAAARPEMLPSELRPLAGPSSRRES